MKKRVLALALTLVMVMSLGSTALAANINGFTDVDSSAWYANAVKYVTDNKYFQGKTTTQFAPNDTMTRGMFVTVLGRFAKVDSTVWIEGEITKSNINVRASASTDSAYVTSLTTGDIVYVWGYTNGWYHIKTKAGQTGYVRNDLMQWKSKFSDLSLLQYYTPYVHWAYTNGIVNGMGERKFAPESSISREQICTMLYKYKTANNIYLPGVNTKTVFSDDSKISSWAKEAVYSMQQAGIIGGRTDGSFDPKTGASRSEVAAILQRFADAITSEEDNKAPFEYTLFGNVVKETTPVTESWFDNACFIGHSMLEALGPTNAKYFSGADFFVKSGATCNTLLSYDQFSYKKNGEATTGTLEQALGAKKYKQIYVMLGINEIAEDSTHFSSNMTDLVKLISTCQPSANIYLISVTPVREGAKKPVMSSQASGSDVQPQDSACTVEDVVKFNTTLQVISVNRNCYYLDVFGSFVAHNGYAKTEYMADDIHLNAAGNQLFRDYLLSHTVAAQPDTPEENGLAALQKTIAQELETQDGKWTVAVTNLATKEQIICKNTETANATPAANLIDIYIAAAVFDRIAEGALTDSATLQAAVKNMIISNNDDATNTVLRLLGDGDVSVGMQRVNAYCQSKGYSATAVNHLAGSSSYEKENFTSAADCNALLTAIYNKTCAGAENMLSLLQQQTIRDKIPAGLPAGAELTIGNKSGVQTGVATHDIAIITGNDVSYALSILTENAKDAQATAKEISRISTLVYMGLS